MTSELTSPCDGSVTDKPGVELSRACDATLLCQSLAQSVGDGSRSVVAAGCYNCSIHSLIRRLFHVSVTFVFSLCLTRTVEQKQLSY